MKYRHFVRLAVLLGAAMLGAISLEKTVTAADIQPGTIISNTVSTLATTAGVTVDRTQRWWDDWDDWGDDEEEEPTTTTAPPTTVKPTTTTVRRTTTTVRRTTTTVRRTTTTVRRTPPTTVRRNTSGYRFPIYGSYRPFVNTWHAPRSGGRKHLGNDIFARRGTKLVAVTNGTATRKWNRLGGKTVWLRGTDGNCYYYAHLNSYARKGKVKKGTVIGYVGNSGNARTTPTHLHFGIKKKCSYYVNPYWSLKKWGGKTPR